MGDVLPLGTRLRQRREELGLTQTQAARQLDVARTAYRLWELEAARPTPDRWRGIASWLGISMTAMLLAEELIDEREASQAQRLVAGVGLTSTAWDAQSNTSEGDYFSQERAMIADQARVGHISAEDAAQLRRILARIQNVTLSAARSDWHPGRFAKRFPNNNFAPALARAALAATVVGIPSAAFDDAILVTSELVTNSVKHTDSEWVEVAITLGADLLRAEVSDQNGQALRPRTLDVHAGWGLALLAELAARWGVERTPGGKTIWVEFDLVPFA